MATLHNLSWKDFKFGHATLIWSKGTALISSSNIKQI